MRRVGLGFAAGVQAGRVSVWGRGGGGGVVPARSTCRAHAGRAGGECMRPRKVTGCNRPPPNPPAQAGWKGLWRGTQPTVIRLGIGAGLHFFFLETIKPFVSDRRPNGTLVMGPLQAAFAGAPLPCRAN